MFKRKGGFMMILVIIFAGTVAIGLFSIVQIGSITTAQNMKTLHQLQAYYLAQSAAQHTALLIKQLPIETFKAFKSNETRDFLGSVNSSCHESLSLMAASTQQDRVSYDIFFPGQAPDEETPYSGDYALLEVSLQASHGGMTATQDSYRFKVQGRVYPARSRGKETVREIIEDEFIVSRFVGGIAAP
jgi:hypothetical protein